VCLILYFEGHRLPCSLNSALSYLSFCFSSFLLAELKKAKRFHHDLCLAHNVPDLCCYRNLSEEEEYLIFFLKKTMSRIIFTAIKDPPYNFCLANNVPISFLLKEWKSSPRRLSHNFFLRKTMSHILLFQQ
jgi:hypothetical protein